uniref:Large ribosomal subunit protein eL19 n=1 Tax=Fervidicoccus fontis TaxID=683846 RepID=A0A7J3ZKM9_9CREN
MSDFTLQKRLAAELLGVGVSRVRFKIASEEDKEDLESAITKEDVRKLIQRGIIYAIPEKSNSRGRWRERKEKRQKGRRRGHGKRKGRSTARKDSKSDWISRIRKMRRYLKYLRDRGIISRKLYRKYYLLAKGGAFANLAALRMHLEKELQEARRA